MRKIIIAALLVVASSTGCNGGTWSHWLDTRSTSVPVTPPVPDSLPAGPITADLVESTNAHRVALEAWDEMDRDEQKDAKKQK